QSNDTTMNQSNRLTSTHAMKSGGRRFLFDFLLKLLDLFFLRLGQLKTCSQKARENLTRLGQSHSGPPRSAESRRSITARTATSRAEAPGAAATSSAGLGLLFDRVRRELLVRKYSILVRIGLVKKALEPLVAHFAHL